MAKLIPVLNKTVRVAFLVLCGACSIYGGDDTEPVEVDGGVVVEVDAGRSQRAAYRVTWECRSAECASPLSQTDTARVFDEGDGSISIEWSRAGDPTATAEHPGGMSGPCMSFDDGTDDGSPRFAYALCPVEGSPAPAVSGDLTWETSTWRATLTRM